MMTLRERVETMVAKRLAEIKQAIRKDSQFLPAWGQLTGVVQEQKDADLMARLSC